VPVAYLHEDKMGILSVFITQYLSALLSCSATKKLIHFLISPPSISTFPFYVMVSPLYYLAHLYEVSRSFVRFYDVVGY